MLSHRSPDRAAGARSQRSSAISARWPAAADPWPTLPHLTAAVCVLAGLAALGCGGAEPDAARMTPSAAGSAHGDGASRPHAPVELGEGDIAILTTGTFAEGPLLSGTLEPARRAVLRSQAGGRVALVSVRPGQAVARGALLARIALPAVDQGAAAARGALRAAETAALVAEQERARTEALFGAGAVATRDVEAARLSAANGRAQVQEAQARAGAAAQEVENTRFVAPFAGVVSARAVNVGDVVQPGAEIVTLIDPSSMQLEGTVPASALDAVRIGAPITFTAVGYPGRSFTGRVTRLYPAVDPATRQVRVLAELPNSGGRLIAGLAAEGRVATRSRSAVLVPTTALESRGPDVGPSTDAPPSVGTAAASSTAASGSPSERASVLRVRGGRTERVSVAIGPRDGGQESVAVLEGLAAGDTVVVGGARTMGAGVPAVVRLTTRAKTGRAGAPLHPPVLATAR